MKVTKFVPSLSMYTHLEKTYQGWWIKMSKYSLEILPCFYTVIKNISRSMNKNVLILSLRITVYTHLKLKSKVNPLTFPYHLSKYNISGLLLNEKFLIIFQIITKYIAKWNFDRIIYIKVRIPRESHSFHPAIKRSIPIHSEGTQSAWERHSLRSVVSKKYTDPDLTRRVGPPPCLVRSLPNSRPAYTGRRLKLPVKEGENICSLYHACRITRWKMDWSRSPASMHQPLRMGRTTTVPPGNLGRNKHLPPCKSSCNFHSPWPSVDRQPLAEGGRILRGSSFSSPGWRSII